METINSIELKQFANKVKERFFCETVKQNGDEISAFDVIKPIRETFSEPNKILIDRVQKDIDKMNRRNSSIFFNKDNNLRRIGSIQFVANGEGYFYALVFYESLDGKIIGSEVVDYTAKVGNCSKEVSNNIKFFIEYLDTLASFVEKNPEMKYVFDYLDSYIYSYNIGDDFISYTLNYNDVNRKAFLTDSSLYAKYDRNINGEGNICDYIDFYSDAYLKRTPINKKDLDEFTQGLIKKYYNNEEMTLQK